MSKKVIECEYCHTLISEEDTNCPSCGANCTGAIKKYRKEQEEKIKAERDKVLNTFGNIYKDTTKTFRIISVFVGVVFLAVFGVIIYGATSTRNNMDNKFDDFNVEMEPEKEEKQEVVTVKYQEEAITKKMKVKLNSYEFYRFQSDSFDSYNTPDGYQKIAFHFEIENLTDNVIFLWSEGISLTADDYEVEETDLKSPGDSFAKVVEGKGNYPDISRGTIKSKSKLKGYVGYLVPKNTEKLKFEVGDYIIIEMDNPAKA